MEDRKDERERDTNLQNTSKKDYSNILRQQKRGQRGQQEKIQTNQMIYEERKLGKGSMKDRENKRRLQAYCIM